jgi:hypothetical protein
MIWKIQYRIAGDNNIKIMKKDLHFTKKHEVGKWFNKNTNRKYFEFINIKPIE